MKTDKLIKDIEYLEKEFPKGKTKFRGQAMVLMALAREEGRAEVLKEVEKFFQDKTMKNLSVYYIKFLLVEWEDFKKQYLCPQTAQGVGRSGDTQKGNEQKDCTQTFPADNSQTTIIKNQKEVQNGKH